MNTRPSAKGYRRAIEALLRKLVQALDPDASLGRTRQSVFNEFADELSDVVDYWGCTYRYLAGRLGEAGVRGPTGAVLTAQALYNNVARAKKAAATTIGSTIAPSGSIRTPRNDGSRQTLPPLQRNASPTGAVPQRLADFVSKLGEATAHEAVTDRILGRGKPTRT